MKPILIGIVLLVPSLACADLEVKDARRAACLRRLERAQREYALSPDPPRVDPDGTLVFVSAEGDGEETFAYYSASLMSARGRTRWHRSVDFAPRSKRVLHETWTRTAGGWRGDINLDCVWPVVCGELT